MNLKFHLLSRIVLIAGTCLIATTAYVLYQAVQQAILETQVTAESIDKQLELQLVHIDAGFAQPERFPDFNLWKETSTASGVCISYLSTNDSLRRKNNVTKLAYLVCKLLPMGFPSRLGGGATCGIQGADSWFSNGCTQR